MPTTQNSVYEDVISFVTSAPSLEEIANYRHTEETLRRVAELKRAAKHGLLTRKQSYELNEFTRADEVMTMLKLRARRRLGLAE